jgi:hypothetical protein
MRMANYPKGPRLRVNVTKEQITAAINADSTHCMIAEAIRVAYPNATHVASDISTCRLSDLDKGHRYVYMTPFSAQICLLDFDEGKRPEPFSFLLKNAHVTKAGGTTPKAKERNLKHRNRKRQEILLSKSRLVGGNKKSGNLPRRVGGKRPPQLRTMRQFGVRAFRGASFKRLQADAQILARAEAMTEKPE